MITSNKRYNIITRCMKVLFMIINESGLNRNLIAGRLGVSSKTVSRYINILRAAGFEIVYNFKKKEYEVINYQMVEGLAGDVK